MTQNYLCYFCFNDNCHSIDCQNDFNSDYGDITKCQVTNFLPSNKVFFLHIKDSFRATLTKTWKQSQLEEFWD